jgi:NAD(P)-dependent dehydrogenase (short-subunit alcohol dehydrogenase family)
MLAASLSTPGRCEVSGYAKPRRSPPRAGSPSTGPTPTACCSTSSSACVRCPPGGAPYCTKAGRTTIMTQQSSPILVTGATGNTGRALVDALNGRGAPVRAMVRAEADRGRLPAGVAVAVADFDDPESLAVALKGTGRAYLVTPSSERAEAQQRRFADLAAEAGIDHLVVLSQLAADENSRPRHSPTACAESCRPGRWKACWRTTRTTGAARQQRFLARSQRSPAGHRRASSSSPATTPRRSPAKPCAGPPCGRPAHRQGRSTGVPSVRPHSAHEPS